MNTNFYNSAFQAIANAPNFFNQYKKAITYVVDGLLLFSCFVEYKHTEFSLVFDGSITCDFLMKNTNHVIMIGIDLTSKSEGSDYEYYTSLSCYTQDKKQLDSKSDDFKTVINYGIMKYS